jgi:Trk K+ transport system NAD-binding subunit
MKITWPVVFVVGGLGLGLGFAGFMREFPPEPERWFLGVLDNVWRALALLVMETDLPDDRGQNWQVVLARLLVPAATLGGIYRVSAGYASRRFNAWRIARMTGHTVVLGAGSRGQALSESSAGPVVVVDRAAGMVAGTSRHPVRRILEGDARDPGTLRAAGVPRARTVVVAAGADTVNLEILEAVVAARAGGPGALDVIVVLHNPAVARQLEREDAFTRRGRGTAAPESEAAALIEVVPVARDRVAAQLLFRDHPLVDLADLRGQSRVHLVTIGWSAFTLEVLEQLARLSPCGRLGAPRVDLLVPHPEIARAELAALQPAFAGGLLEMHYHGLKDRVGLPAPDQMAAIEPGPSASVTAVLIATGSDEDSASLAMALRDRSHIEGRWRGPIFVRLASTGSLTRLLARRAGLVDQSDRIVPVGMLATTCRLEHVLGDRDQAARALHAAYVDARGAAPLPLEKRTPAERPWALLEQTYRIANRRAVDHLPIKLLSAGYAILGRPLRTAPGIRLGAEPREMEALAELEHRSWEIDRVLDGWRPGPSRDAERRIHEAIGVPWAELDERLGKPVRQYDRDQIEVASRMLAQASGPVTVRRVVSVDPESLDGGSAAGVAAGLATAHPEDLISILIVPRTEGQLAWIEDLAGGLRKAGVHYRLVLVQAMPLAALAPAVRQRLDRMTGEHPNLVADLVPVASVLADWDDPEHREEAWRRARAWIEARR